MQCRWLCQLCPTTVDHKTIIVFCSDIFLYISFNTVHFKWWQVFTIRHYIQSIFVTANTCKQFNMGIPRCNIIISYWPFYSVSELGRIDKFIFTPAWTCTSPDNWFTSDLVPAYPFEWFLLYVWMIIIFYKKMCRVFAKACCLGNQRICL
jgi:hypothetical protein